MFLNEGIGTNFLLFIECFIVYSFIGWVVESIYMSFCEHKLTNRGFAKGPMCPIYGCGGAIGYILLRPLADNVIALYFVGTALATTFEFMVGILMIHFLNKVWWDYNEKPFNYRGIICLESSIAWGFYAVIIVKFLNPLIVSYLQLIPKNIARGGCAIIITIYLVDFFYHLLEALDMTPAECKDKIVENVRNFRSGR